MATSPGAVARMRDWIHSTPLSLCSEACDSCPDWELAAALVDLADGKPLTPRQLDALGRVANLRLEEKPPEHSRHWLFRRGE